MPPLRCEDVRRMCEGVKSFDFVGVADCLCFRGCEQMEVVVYILTAKSWSWLLSSGMSFTKPQQCV